MMAVQYTLFQTFTLIVLVDSDMTEHKTMSIDLSILKIKLLIKRGVVFGEELRVVFHQGGDWSFIRGFHCGCIMY